MADVCLIYIIFSVLLFTEGAAPCTDCTSFFLCRKFVQLLCAVFVWENLKLVQTAYFFFVHFIFVFLYKKIRLEKSVQSAFGNVQVLGFTFLGSNLCLGNNVLTKSISWKKIQKKLHLELWSVKCVQTALINSYFETIWI